MRKITRRSLTRLSGASVAAIALGGSLSGCSPWTSHRYGIVELGAGGPKWSVLEFSEHEVVAGANAPSNGGAQRWTKYQRNEKAHGDITVEVTDRTQIPQVVIAVKQAAGHLTENNVDAQRRVFVASSSVARLPNDHLADLRAALLAEGIDIEIVNAEQEADYAFRWIVPHNDRERAAFIDIGSGNIKGGHINPETGEFRGFEIPQGAATIMRAAEAVQPAPDVSIADTIQREVESSVTPQLSARAADGFGSEVVFLGGGSVWAMRALTHPTVPEDQTWVELTAAEITAYRNAVRADPTLGVFVEGLSPSAPLRRIVGAIHEAIPQENRLLAGAEILSAISREFDFAAAGVRVFFADEAQYAWSTMYLLAKLRIEQRIR